MASPERIARAAEARSPARSTMLSPEDAATSSAKARDVSDLSASTMTTPSSRITGWLNTAASTAKANSGTLKIKISAARSCSSHRHSRRATKRNPGFGFRLMSQALSARPIQVGAHAGAQLRHLVDRVGADRERAQVEIAGGAGGAPACIFAFGGDQFDLDGDAAVGERRDAYVEAVADLQRFDEIFAQIEVDPHVIEIDQGYQRHAGRDVFAGLHVALVDLRGYRRVDHHLLDDRLHGRDVGDRLLHGRCGDFVLLFGVAVDRLLVRRFGLIYVALAFMQRIGRLVEPRNRRVAVLGQLADAVVGLLCQN